MIAAIYGSTPKEHDDAEDETKSVNRQVENAPACSPGQKTGPSLRITSTSTTASSARDDRKD